LVWSGEHGDGLIAVVDFGGFGRRDPNVSHKYVDWGQICSLYKPVSVGTVLNEPLLRPTFGKRIQSAYRLDPDVRLALTSLVGRWPAPVGKARTRPRWDEPIENFSPIRDPDGYSQRLVWERPELAEAIGFSPRLEPKERILQNGMRADLWDPAGVVGETKWRITGDEGPSQLEGYIVQCQREWSDREWRGVLVQSAAALAESAERRLKQSHFQDQINVWSVWETEDGEPRYENLWPLNR
jgi:hypothetical protein